MKINSLLERIVSTLVDWTGKPLPINTLEFVRANVQDGGSDNGPYRRGKGSIYEGGVLVPSFLILPGRLPPNEVSSRVTVQDVLPTLAAVVGLELSEGHKLDGTNQWPIIKGEATAISGDYLIAGMDGEAYYQGDWKLVMAAGEEPALYNLENDPTEQRDLAGEEAERVEELRKRLEQFPRGESIHQTAWYDIFLDPDRFGGGGEDRLPWIEQVREQ